MNGENEGLPAGWVLATLGDLVDRMQYGHTASAASSAEGPRFLRITDLREDGIAWAEVPGCIATSEDVATYALRDGDVVFARTGSIEKAALVRNPPEAIFASYLIRGRPLTPVLSEWIGHFVHSGSYLQQIGAAGAGIGRENVNASKLSAVRIPVAPEPEQRRILAKLNELLASTRAARVALDVVPALMERYRQAVLSAGFRGALTADWRTENSAPTADAGAVLRRVETMRAEEWLATRARGTYSPAVDTMQGPFELPRTWRWASLEQLTSAVSSICYGVVQPGDEMAAGVPLVRVCDIEGGKVRVSELRTVTPEVDAQYARSRLRGGEVLVTVVGTIGRVAVAPASLTGANIARAVARLCPMPPVTSDWIAYALMTPEAQAILTRESREVARKTLNVGSLAQVLIPVAPEKEMREIIRRVTLHVASYERQLTTVLAARTEVCRLEQASLRRAFHGELVPQDPNDEPVSTLLARLRSEGADTPASRLRRRIPART